MIDKNVGESDEPVRPRLWNPNTAANLSLIFTPAFGASLHAANWRTLNKPDRAAANMAYAWGTVSLLILAIMYVFAEHFHLINGTFNDAIRIGLSSVGTAQLIAWYFMQGRAQVRYVKETFDNDYIKRPWGLPLLAGLAGWATWLSVLFGIGFVLAMNNESLMTETVKASILEEWRKKPEIQSATIQQISLTDKHGDTHTGSVDATLNGQPVKLYVTVKKGFGTFQWQLSETPVR